MLGITCMQNEEETLDLYIKNNLWTLVLQFPTKGQTTTGSGPHVAPSLF